MHRRDELRRHLTNRDEFVTPTRDLWVMTEQERSMMRDRPVKAVRPERSTWRLALAALAFSLGMLALQKCHIDVHKALDSIPWAWIFNYQPVSPIDPGDQNGLLHEH